MISRWNVLKMIVAQQHSISLYHSWIAQVVSVQVVDNLGYDGVGLQAQSGEGWVGGIVWVGVI